MVLHKSIEIVESISIAAGKTRARVRATSRRYSTLMLAAKFLTVELAKRGLFVELMAKFETALVFKKFCCVRETAQ